jgi:hypothetical protein
MPEPRSTLSRAEKWPRQGPGSLAAILVAARSSARSAPASRHRPAPCGRLCLSRLPLWSGIGHLRLAEEDEDRERNANEALRRFAAVRSRWGEIRARAVLTSASRIEVTQQVNGIGPVDPFVPGSPWLM